MKRLLVNGFKEVFLSSLFMAGALITLSANPAYAFRFNRQPKSTNGGFFSVEYALGDVIIGSQGVPISGKFEDFGIIINPSVDGNGGSTYNLLSEAPNLDAKVTFGTNNLDCPLTDFSKCTSPNEIREGDAMGDIDFSVINLSNIASADFIPVSDVETLYQGLRNINTNFLIDFKGCLSSTALELASLAPCSNSEDPSKDPGYVEGRFEVFFSKPKEEILSFGKLYFKTDLPSFVDTIPGLAQERTVADENGFSPLEPSTTIPEPSATASLLIIGLAYGIKRTTKRS